MESTSKKVKTMEIEEPRDIWLDPDYDLVDEHNSTPSKKKHWWIVKLPTNRPRYRPI